MTDSRHADMLLAEFRRAFKNYSESKSYSPESWEWARDGLIAMANMNEWLCSGGTLPRDWRH